MSDIFGEKIKINIFGESHGTAIGVVIDGLPSGILLDFNAINRDLSRRAPGKSEMATSRKEDDSFEIISGFFEKRTTGTSLCAIIKNSDTKSKDYDQIKKIIRPGHADFPASIKYNNFMDYRGGGHFSGRLTAPLVLAGAICKQILDISFGMKIFARVKSIANISDMDISHVTPPSNDEFEKIYEKTLPVFDNEKMEKMEKIILQSKKSKDSVGGVIEVFTTNTPAGLGAPFFDSVESTISHLAFSVPAVKGIEFGAGFSMTHLFGSQTNDEYYLDGGQNIKTKTNNNGGILGGITSGMPIVFSVAIKPTPSIAKKQSSVNISEMKEEIVEIKGRHDPCIVPRAIPVMEAITAIALVQYL